MKKTASEYLRELADYLEGSSANVGVMVHQIDWRKIPNIPGKWGGGCVESGPYTTFTPSSDITGGHDTTFFPEGRKQ